MQSFDVIVIGVGGMGAPTCYQLAKRGIKVLGLEQFELGHKLGSSHGETRVIRKAYFEHPDYVPLLERAYELWEELSAESKHKFFHQTGLIYFGYHGSKLLAGVRSASEKYEIPLEELSEKELKNRYPQFNYSKNFEAIYEPEAGYLEVEESVTQFSELAKKYGAKLQVNEEVLSWSADTISVEVTTNKKTYISKSLIITAGAWSDRILKDLNLPLKILRKLTFWFPSNESLNFGAIPCFLYDLPYGVFYGFPKINELGVKVAEHSGGEIVEDVQKLDRSLKATDQKKIIRFVQDNLPTLPNSPSKHSVCMYTMTPDENFIIDRHPQHSNVFLAAGFSGHGFKFASVIGGIMADLAIKRTTDQPIEFLNLKRFMSN